MELGVKRPWYQSLTLGLSSIAKIAPTVISSLGLEEQSEQLVRTPSRSAKKSCNSKNACTKPKINLADEFLGELDEDNIELVLSRLSKCSKQITQQF